MSSSDARAAARRFLRIFMGALVALAAAMLGLCWLVAPSGLLHQSAFGPAVCAPGIHSSDERYAKPLLSSVLQPDEAIVGSSRAIAGFTADAFGERRVANLALSGATLAEVDAVARHAADGGHVERVWIGLDFGQFVTEESPREPLVLPSPGQSQRWVAVRFGLLDPRAVRATLRSLLVDQSCTNPLYTTRGFLARPLPQSDSLELAGRRTLASISRRWDATRAGRAQLYRQSLRRLEQLLAHLRRRGVSVVVFLGPSSGAYRSAVAQSGLDPAYQRWRRDVAAIARRHRAGFVAGDAPDFLSPLARRTCGAGENADCLFSDAVHFRPAVGAAIVRAALAPERSHAQ